MSRVQLFVLAGLAAVVATAGVAALVLRGDDAPSPAGAATAFAAAWSDGDTGEMQSWLTEPAADLAADLDRWTGGLDASRHRHEVVGDAEHRGDGEATVVIRSTYEVTGVGEWGFDHALALRELDDDQRWGVVWRSDTVHPDLGPDQRLRSSLEWPERAPILGIVDQPIAGPVESVVVGVEPRRVTDRGALTTALQQSLGLDPVDVDRALDAPGVQPDHFVTLQTLRRSEFEEVRDVIHPIPGTVFRETTGRGAPTPEFARHLIGRVDEITAARLDELGDPYSVGDRVGLSGLEARYEEQLAGTPSGTVDIVDDTGPVAELHRVAGSEPEPLRTTIDPAVQLAVEETIGDRTDPLAIVVVDAGNNVRAVASRPLTEPDRAVSGQYPPGSTFKVVTASALLEQGVGPTSPVECPGSLDVDGRPFTNFESDALGSTTFEEAFVRSCNTAIISAAEALPEGAIVAHAGRFGFGVDYAIGTPVAASRVPEPDGATERAATAIGQAGILATPLHMATVSATVIDGIWEHPTLVLDHAGSAAEPDPGGLGEHRGTLDALMAGVVERGSETSARSLDGIRGKTGTAEYGSETPPRTHAWFIGHREDLAVAVLLEDGGVGGQDAAPVAGALFARLDAP